MPTKHHINRTSKAQRALSELPTAADTIRFNAKVSRTDGCWYWTGAMAGTGYGSFGYRGVAVPAHRFSYAVHRGFIPPGMVLDHLCRVKLCVNLGAHGGRF